MKNLLRVVLILVFLNNSVVLFAPGENMRKKTMPFCLDNEAKYRYELLFAKKFEKKLTKLNKKNTKNCNFIAKHKKYVSEENHNKRDALLEKALKLTTDLRKYQLNLQIWALAHLDSDVKSKIDDEVKLL